MSIIRFKEANCKNCHKCIRSCPVKSIRFYNEQAQILPDECILCGNCFLVCPQNAKQIRNDIDKVKALINAGNKVYVSLAPSFAAAFKNVSFAQIVNAFKKLGFSGVEETSIGATRISRELEDLLEEKKMDNIITTCCTTSVLLVEKHFPDLVGMLSNLVSPAMAHARMLKKTYGEDIKVVFIGPCISKKYEGDKNDAIDISLMFDEVFDWLADEGIKFVRDETDSDQVPAVTDPTTRLYPIPGGILRTLDEQKKKNYKCVAVDGLDRCIEVLKSIQKGEVHGYLIEMSACENSCVAGPGMSAEKISFLTSLDSVEQFAAQNGNKEDVSQTELVKDIDLKADYSDKHVEYDMPSEDEIREILAYIGKTSSEQMYNCSACGYPTCRDKAIAVYQGKADLKMCIPFMREKAESMSNIMLDHTPNALIITDNLFNILEYNNAAIKIFNLYSMNYHEMPLQMAVGEEINKIAVDNPAGISDYRVHVNEGKTVYEFTMVHIKENDNYLIIVKDVTEEEQNLQKLNEIREKTIETTQKVIDKQMRVAQEIASLLGETTGQTKAALTKLKSSMAETSNR